MNHHRDNDMADALNDYLDALVGEPPEDSRAQRLNPELRESTDQFFDLASRAGIGPHKARRLGMDISQTLGGTSQSTPRVHSRKWTLPTGNPRTGALMTGLMFLGVVALVFTAYLSFGLGQNTPSGDEPSRYAAAPAATVAPDATTSALPYPGAELCTVEPMSRDEMIEHIQEANITTAPEFPLYEQPIEPSAEDVDAIIDAYNQWKACGLDTPETGFSYQLRHQSVWHTASSLPAFYTPDGGSQRPLTDEQIESYVDGILGYEEAQGTPATPDATVATPPEMGERQLPEIVPIPDGATPIVLEGGRAFPILFAEDIMVTGPDTATATLYWVDENTNEITAGPHQVIQFVNVDGEWLILDLRQGGLG